MPDPSSRQVLVTGATANIGRAIALAFAAQGDQVFGIGRDEAAGARLVAEGLAAGAAQMRFIAAELTDPDAATRIIAEIAAPIDVLINNVGGNIGAGLFANSDPASWAGDIDLNLGTVLRMSHAVLPGMIAHRRGAIVNIGSTAGLVGDYMLPVYSAAKAAVHGFTKVLAKEVAQHGVRVNAVAPYGAVSSDPAAFSAGSRFHADNAFFQTAFAGASPEDHALRARRTLVGRPVARPEEVASLVIWLAGEGAGFVTGQIYAMDGGSLL
jgi:2-hydroxycyclohexanecarboxyl-CoA dehydrogenase